MQLKRFLTEREDAVSPVIGIILMVAITVILAAVIASFVIGLGPGEAAPTVNFNSEYESSSNTLTVSVTGGDSVPHDQLSFSGSGISSIQGNPPESHWPVGHASGSVDGETAVQSGDDVELTTTLNSYSIDVVWISADESTTQTLTTFER